MSQRLRLIALDTAHWAGLVTDLVSDSNERRRSASRFMPKLLERGWMPLLCFHHLEELLQHRDEDLVDARLRYLRDLPHVAWIRPNLVGGGPGAVTDLLRHEIATAVRGEMDPLRVRDGTKEEAIHFGSGLGAIPVELDIWRMLQGALEQRAHGARRVAAIGAWRATAEIENQPMSALMGRPFASLAEVMPRLQRQRKALADEIATRGDKRIEDPTGMAAEFMDSVVRAGLAAANAPGADPAVQALINAGLDPEDIDPAASLKEMLDLVVYRKRLAIGAEGLDVPWADVKRVAPTQLPTTIIERAMKVHAQDQPERKGSELNDTHLLCLASCADLTLVDKRTLENVRRLRAKDADAHRLLGPVERAPSYASIPDLLDQLSVSSAAVEAR